MRFDPPPRFRPVALPEPLGSGSSPGVLVPFSASGSESPRPARRGPRFPGCGPVPTGSLRCRSQPSSGSQQLDPLAPVPPCFRRMTLVGFALQGFVPPAQPRWLVTTGMPSWPSPAVTAPPRFGASTGASIWGRETVDRRHLRPSGPCSARESICIGHRG
jgi:hypothetical protein